ncbi:hypothetical protein [Colwellia sp. E150_009]
MTKLEVFATILAVIALLVSMALKYFSWGLLISLCVFIYAFYKLLESNLNRLEKGIALILFGIFWSEFFIKIMFYDKPYAAEYSQDILDKLLIFKNLAIYACAGAGGSIIANHSEQFSKEKGKVICSCKGNQSSLETLIESLDANNKKLLKYTKILTLCLIALVIAFGYFYAKLI